MVARASGRYVLSSTESSSTPLLGHGVDASGRPGTDGIARPVITEELTVLQAELRTARSPSRVPAASWTHHRFARAETRDQVVRLLERGEVEL